MKNDLLKLKGLTPEQLKEYLSTLTEGEQESMKGQQEGYYLMYPNGTEDEELEDLLQNLDELWHPEYYEELQQDLQDMRDYQLKLQEQQLTTRR